MNDTRLRELAREAGIKLMNDEVLALGYLPATQKKFARLIIQESIKVMMEHDYHGEWLGEKIKEHFGVE